MLSTTTRSGARRMTARSATARSRGTYPGRNDTRVSGARPVRGAVRPRSASTRAVIWGGALPPKAALILRPLYAGGLWLAVMQMPSGAPVATTWQDTIGVVTGTSDSVVGMPFPSSTAATVSAKRALRKRTS